MSYLLVLQYDCETQILSKLEEATVENVFQAICPDISEVDISYFRECAEYAVSNIVEIGADIPVNLNDGDDTDIYYLINLN